MTRTTSGRYLANAFCRRVGEYDTFALALGAANIGIREEEAVRKRKPKAAPK